MSQAEVQMQMPRYLGRKVVHALKIEGIEHTRDHDESVKLHVERPFNPIQITKAWFMSHTPEPNGYFVQYADGYTSYSPPGAFDAGYVRIDNPPPFADVKLHRRIGNDRQPFVTVLDAAAEPSNAHHQYLITPPITDRPAKPPMLIEFLTLEHEGVTNEALLAIVAHRLQCFQKSKFACRENALALTKIEEALHWLESRTLDRTSRGVEGTHTP